MKRFLNILLTAAILLLAACNKDEGTIDPGYLEGAAQYDGTITAQTSYGMVEFSEASDATVYLKEAEDGSMALILTSLELTGLLKQIAAKEGYTFTDTVDLALALPGITKQDAVYYEAASVTPTAITGEALSFDGFNGITDVAIETGSGEAYVSMVVSITYNLGFGNSTYNIYIGFSSSEVASGGDDGEDDGDTPTPVTYTHVGTLNVYTESNEDFELDYTNEGIYASVDTANGSASVTLHNFCLGGDFENDFAPASVTFTDIPQNVESPNIYYASTIDGGTTTDTTGDYSIGSIYVEFMEEDSNAIRISITYMEFYVEEWDEIAMHHYEFINYTDYNGTADVYDPDSATTPNHTDGYVNFRLIENLDGTVDIYNTFTTDSSSAVYVVIKGVEADATEDGMYGASAATATDVSGATSNTYNVTNLGTNQYDETTVGLWYDIEIDGITYHIVFDGSLQEDTTN
ncbi:MAG: hypothetical protein R3Y68_02795 [Rikenellaceae bacterium]